MIFLLRFLNKFFSEIASYGQGIYWDATDSYVYVCMNQNAVRYIFAFGCFNPFRMTICKTSNVFQYTFNF